MHITLTGTGSPGGDRPDIIATSFARLLRERIVGTPSRFIAGARPAGVALRVDPRADESEAFEVTVVDAEARPLLVLGPFGEDDVVAVWRSLAVTSGLPLVLQDGEGALQTPFPQIGPVRLGDVHVRRLHGLLKGRRPRFLVRRKPSRLPRRPHIHCEREIVGGSAV